MSRLRVKKKDLIKVTASIAAASIMATCPASLPYGPLYEKSARAETTQEDRYEQEILQKLRNPNKKKINVANLICDVIYEYTTLYKKDFIAMMEKEREVLDNVAETYRNNYLGYLAKLRSEAVGVFISRLYTFHNLTIGENAGKLDIREYDKVGIYSISKMWCPTRKLELTKLVDGMFYLSLRFFWNMPMMEALQVLDVPINKKFNEKEEKPKHNPAKY